MFITMDVVFHEELMNFSLKSEPQGEYCQEEIQTLDYVVQDAVKDYESQTRPIDRQEDEVDNENVEVVSNMSEETSSQVKSLISDMSQPSLTKKCS